MPSWMRYGRQHLNRSGADTGGGASATPAHASAAAPAYVASLARQDAPDDASA